MKFQRVNDPKYPWSKEKFESQIANTENDLREFSKELTFLDNWISQINDKKRHISAKQSNKEIYLNQLKADYEKAFT